ncbi:unnamed protein product [Periconia digitata]|uniref:Zn(2)-C6 fungal-type domain-containing protein n=1 Tax=Periconia digitata TaxID=1303443 RepID=A0A9W4US89_9PLEO|nr:unnamed protein product [Periconia digitata]
MVYRGKPSSACLECRKKRSRCDQAVPSCGQCVRTKRKCSGYRNTMDLMFFDQTQEAAQKSRQQSQPASSRSRSITPPTKQTIQTAAIQQSLSNVVICESLDDLAVNYFMRIYVGNNPDTAQFGWVSGLADSTGGRSSSELQQSLKAVGLAGYARVSQRPDLLMTATRSYMAAVREINHKLSSSKLGDDENALVTAVVLLAMFEIMALPNEEGYRNFSRHIRGAVSIACMLLEQNKHVDEKLLKSIMYCVIGESWVGNQGFPPEFYTLFSELGPQKQTDSIYAQMVELLIENMSFRHSLSSGALSSPRDIIAEGLRIHDRTRKLMSAPNMSRHSNIFLPPPVGDPFHDAPFFGMFFENETRLRVHCWNNIRLCWLHLHRIIVAQCSMLLSTGTDPSDKLVSTQPESVSIAYQQAASTTAVKDLAREVCESMPNIGKHGELGTSFKSLEFELGETSDFLNMEGMTFPNTMDVPASVLMVASPRASGLFVIYYQLQNLSTISDLPPDLLDWIRGHLEEIRSITDPNDTRFLHTLLQQQRLDQESPIESPGILIKSST